MKSVVNKRACATCPFRRDCDDHFLPETLDATVGSNLRTGYAHNCHNTLSEERRTLVCAGFTRFVVENDIPNNMLQLAERLGIFDPKRDVDRKSDFELESWDAVLEMHRKREQEAR